MLVTSEHKQDQDADRILTDSGSLMEEISKFIDDKSQKNIPNQHDCDQCLLFIDELEQCLRALEEMHHTYQVKLRKTDTRVQGISGYAQTMSLTSFTTRGDLTHVE